MFYFGKRKLPPVYGNVMSILFSAFIAGEIPKAEG